MHFIGQRISIIILVSIFQITSSTIANTRTIFAFSVISSRFVRRSITTTATTTTNNNNMIRRRRKDSGRKEQQMDAVVVLSSSKHEDQSLLSNSSSKNTENILFWKWATHQETSFHHFTPSEATAIRETLLQWYRTNRRKLPWRGDPPPYDGSTAGIITTTASSSSKARARNNNKNKTKNGSNAKTSNKKQTNLHGFFSVKKPEQSNEDDDIDNKITEIDDGKLNSLPISQLPLIPVSAYGVWVSEIMLQQTRVEAVIPYWIEWMKSFPTVEALAMASEDEVNARWAGLGFYRRAKLLHQGAQYVVKELHGKLPTTAHELQQICGIGPYTASAIASIAFGECVPVVDGNVCRVLSRLRGICQHIKAPIFKDRHAWDLAKQIVEAGNGQDDAGDVNQALMELGATYCAPSASGMDDRDPLKPMYMSTKLAQEYANLRRDDSELSTRLEQVLSCHEETGCKVCDVDGVRTVLNNLLEGLDQLDVSEEKDPVAIGKCGHSVFPMAPPKLAKREEVLAVLALKWSMDDGSSSTKQTDRWLLVKRPKDGLLAGQWEFPSVCVWTSEDQASERGHRRKDMSSQVPIIDASERSKALSSFLNNIYLRQDHIKECVRNQLESPIEHIFSHVRHTMWIEAASIQKELEEGHTQLGWTSPSGREVRWMSESDMKSVGVTSGVKRILKTVNQQVTTKVKSNKRKR